MKNFNSIKKLVSGAILLLFGFFMVYKVGESGWEYCEKQVRIFLDTFLPTNLAGFLSIVFSLVLAFYSVRSFIYGMYKVLTFRQYLEEFDSGSDGKAIIVHKNDLYPNINRVLGYREACMAGMNDSKAAYFLNSTAKLDSLYTGYYSGSNTLKALNFVESRLSGMNNEKAISYLQGKIR